MRRGEVHLIPGETDSGINFPDIDGVIIYFSPESPVISVDDETILTLNIINNLDAISIFGLDFRMEYDTNHLNYETYVDLGSATIDLLVEEDGVIYLSTTLTQNNALDIEEIGPILGSFTFTSTLAGEADINFIPDEINLYNSNGQILDIDIMMLGTSVTIE